MHKILRESLGGLHVPRIGRGARAPQAPPLAPSLKGSDCWGAESPLVMKCPFFRLSMTWHLPKSLCLGFFKIYTLANIMGFLFSVSFLCESTFYHSFDKLGNCLDNLCFEWGKLFFSNNTDTITTIHLWKFFSRYSVCSAPCTVERRHWCAARSNKRFMLYDFFWTDVVVWFWTCGDVYSYLL